MSPESKKQRKKPKNPEPVDTSTQIMQLINKVDGLQNLLGNAMAQNQKLEQRINENWTKFVFHEHSRFDRSGPQYYNEEYEKSYFQEQERKKAAQTPPAPPTPPEKDPKSDKK